MIWKITFNECFTNHQSQGGFGAYPENTGYEVRIRQSITGPYEYMNSHTHSHLLKIYCAQAIALKKRLELAHMVAKVP